MSRIISFGWTAAAVKARRKSVTRRAWAVPYGESFREGEELQAWTQAPFVPGAHRFGTIRLVEKPAQRLTSWQLADEWEAEGFAYMEEQGLTLPVGTKRLTPREFWDRWKLRAELLWVVRFEIVELFE